MPTSETPTCPAVNRDGYPCELVPGHDGDLHRALIGATDEQGAIPEVQWRESPLYPVPSMPKIEHGFDNHIPRDESTPENRSAWEGIKRAANRTTPAAPRAPEGPTTPEQRVCKTCGRNLTGRPDTNHIRVYWVCSDLRCEQYHREQGMTLVADLPARAALAPLSGREAALRSAAERYIKRMRHGSFCGAYGLPCDCGFDDLRAALSEWDAPTGGAQC